MSSIHDLGGWCHGDTLRELVRVARGLAEEQRAVLEAMERAAGKDR